MTQHEDVAARARLRELIAEEASDLSADYLSGIAQIAHTVAREELERAGVTPAPWQSPEERGHVRPAKDRAGSSSS